MQRWLAAAALAGALGASTRLAGAEHARRRFDPEDLQLEAPGAVHADLAFGLVRGEEAGRWLLPDFDLDVGLAPNVEIGIDGAWSLEGTPARLLARDHPAPDNLWFSSKLGLWDSRREGEARSWALGAQLGPRLPLAPGAHGAGFQGILLVGRSLPGLHLVLNGGAMIDPGEAVASQRPLAALAGLDAVIALDHQGRWTLALDLSGLVFAAQGRHQLAATVGPVWSAAPWLDLGLSGLVGLLPGGDRYGAYLTISPRIQVF